MLLEGRLVSISEKGVLMVCGLDFFNELCHQPFMKLMQFWTVVVHVALPSKILGAMVEKFCFLTEKLQNICLHKGADLAEWLLSTLGGWTILSAGWHLKPVPLHGSQKRWFIFI